MRRALLLLVPALLLTACGREARTSGPAGGAEVAPATTAFLLRAKVEPGSARWQQLEPLLKLFPAAGDAVPDLSTLEGALGPETDALAFGKGLIEARGIVGLTQPPDPAKLQTALAKQDPPLVSEEVASWYAIAADRRTLDRFKRARNEGSLAGTDAYKDATSGLPAGALATVYVDGPALTRELDKREKTGLGPIPGLGRVSWLAGSLTEKPGGLGVSVRVKGDEIELSTFTAELPAEVPTPVSALLDAKGLDATLDELKRSPALSDRLGPIAKALGSGLLDDVIGLFEGEAAIYARPLEDGPEYTVLVKVDDEEQAKETLDRLATLAGALSQKVPEHPVIAGVPTTKIVYQKTTLYYAVFDGKVVLTTKPSGIRGAAGTGPRLADSPSWQAAADAAGLPDETAGIAYADLQQALPLLETLAGAKPQPGPSPFGTGLLWASVDGSVLSVSGFVSVR